MAGDVTIPVRQYQMLFYLLPLETSVGAEGFEGEANTRALEEVLAMDNVFVHLYGKKNKLSLAARWDT